MQGPLRVLLPAPGPSLQQVPEEGRSSRKDGFVARQLEFRSESVLRTARIGPLAIGPVRSEHQSGIGIIADLQKIPQIGLECVRRAEFLTQPSQQVDVDVRVVRTNIARVQIAQQRRKQLHVHRGGAQFEADAGSVTGTARQQVSEIRINTHSLLDTSLSVRKNLVNTGKCET